MSKIIEQAMQELARGQQPRDPARGLHITEDEAEFDRKDGAESESKIQALVQVAPKENPDDHQ